jgi:filamentous hemagglutinin family protein
MNMYQQRLDLVLPLSLAGSLLVSALMAPPGQAQIVPDTTLPIHSQVTTTGNTSLITGGTESGVNLYHSFREFSVLTGNTAWFNNAPQIQNVLTRVTGNSISNIDGLLKANGTASLFLLNPNGILFGPNARLEIGGSFFASTASSFQFANGSEFSAINPQTPPLLTVSVVPGLQRGPISPGSTLTDRGNLTAGQDLTLEADILDLQGTLLAGKALTLLAQDTVRLRDTLTTPFMAAAGGTLQVQGNQSVDIFALNHPDSGFWSGGDLVLRSDNPVVGDAHFYTGGNLRVDRLDGQPGDLLSPNDPIILALGNVELGDYVGESLHILAGGSVSLGNVRITGTGATATTINPNNTALFNGSKTYADLATFNLTEYKATLNSDGTVRSVDPVAVPIVIDGSTRATLDVRAGVDWAQLGGLPTNPVLVGVFMPAPIDPVGTNPTADITVTGGIRVDQPGGLVLLTNQFSPNTLPGTISIRGNIDTSTAISETNGGDIQAYGRGDITVFGDPSNRIFLNSGSDSFFGDGVNGGVISFSTNSGTISLQNSDLDLDLRSFSFSGNGGAVSFSTNSGTISLQNSDLNLSSLSFSGTGGNGGAVSFLTNSGTISLQNSSLRLRSDSFLDSGNAGNGGAVSFLTNSGTISLQNSDLDSSSFSNSGTGGNGGQFHS